MVTAVEALRGSHQARHALLRMRAGLQATRMPGSSQGPHRPRHRTRGRRAGCGRSGGGGGRAQRTTRWRAGWVRLATAETVAAGATIHGGARRSWRRPRRAGPFLLTSFGRLARRQVSAGRAAGGPGPRSGDRKVPGPSRPAIRRCCCRLSLQPRQSGRRVSTGGRHGPALGRPARRRAERGPAARVCFRRPRTMHPRRRPPSPLRPGPSPWFLGLAAGEWGAHGASHGRRLPRRPAGRRIWRCRAWRLGRWGGRARTPSTTTGAAGPPRRPLLRPSPRRRPGPVPSLGCAFPRRAPAVRQGATGGTRRTRGRCSDWHCHGTALSPVPVEDDCEDRRLFEGGDSFLQAAAGCNDAVQSHHCPFRGSLSAVDCTSCWTLLKNIFRRLIVWF